MNQKMLKHLLIHVIKNVRITDYSFKTNSKLCSMLFWSSLLQVEYSSDGDNLGLSHTMEAHGRHVLPLNVFISVKNYKIRTLRMQKSVNNQPM